MNEEWLIDGRKIPDEVMGYIRKIAVQAVRENGQSPEVVAKGSVLILWDQAVFAHANS